MSKQKKTSKLRKPIQAKSAGSNRTNFSCYVLLKDIFKDIKTERKDDGEYSHNTPDSTHETTTGINIKEENEEEEDILTFDGDYELVESDLVKEEEKFGDEPINSEEISNESADKVLAATELSEYATVSLNAQYNFY